MRASPRPLSIAYLATFILAVPLFPLLLFSQTESNVLQNSNFFIHYSEDGVVGLANPNDPFGAQMLAPGQHLGVLVRYRVAQGNWKELLVSAGRLQASPAKGRIVYQTASNAPLQLTQTFELRDSAFDWDLAFESTLNTPVEIGDLAITLPVAGPRGEEPKAIFEHGFLRHQFISGNGSFIYFVRASGVPPFLIMLVKPGTKLEYFSGGFGGRGGAQVYVHSGASGSREQRGTWRQEHTSLKLEPAKTGHATASYGFRFRWARSYGELRQILFEEGLFDIRAVPGMTIPRDLTARFSLHTRAGIESLQAEFPSRTRITPVTTAAPDCQVYEVQFERLGENLLTIRHDGGRKTYLEYFITEPLETLIKKRSAFIADRQQIRDPSKWWDGVFGPYDMRHEIVRTIDDPDIFTGRMVYVLTCDDPGLCKAPFVAEKNVSSPEPKEIEALEYYLQHFVWGKLQLTDKESPYPYGVYGTPNWYVDRDPERRKAYAASANETARRDLQKEHVWRSYDYPHVVMFYFHMYEIAKNYPRLCKYLDAAGYLERAWQTARAFFTYPCEIYPLYYETYKWGLYNELIVLKLADALDANSFPDRAAWLRSEWEKKVKYFVYDDQYPFRSEYAFDRTAFESSYAFAKYGATHNMKPDTNLWYDVKLKRWYSHPQVAREDSRAFMERQLAAGLSVRGWLETSYYQLGADGGLSYMAAMGGWGILDYAVNFAPNPTDWLQLGYASYLSSWCLMNTGTAESNYGFWFPGPTNDGAAGWQFMSAKYGRAWMGAEVPRGPWHYDGEIDLGFGGALRMAATILTRDPIFDWIAYGGTLNLSEQNLFVVPRDGLRQRFYALLPNPAEERSWHKLKLELDRDGFASSQPIIADKSLKTLKFTLENRTGDEHTTTLHVSLPSGKSYVVTHNGTPCSLVKTADWDYPFSVTLSMARGNSKIEFHDKGPAPSSDNKSR